MILGALRRERLSLLLSSAGRGRERGRRIPRLTAAFACALAGFGLGLFGEWAFSHTGASIADLVRDLAVGWTYIAVGLVFSYRRPQVAVGPLMVAEGLSWFIGNLQGVSSPLLVAIGFWLEGLNLAILGHLVLSLPDGRLRSRTRRLVVFLGYGVVATVGLVRTLAYSPAVHPGASYLSCPSCSENQLFVRDMGPFFPALDLGYKGAGVVLGAVTAGLILRRWLRTPRPNRQRALTVWSLAALVALGVTAWHLPEAGHRTGLTAESINWLTDLIQVGVPLSFLFIPLQRQLATAAVADLVVEVGRSPSSGRLRDALARALRDPWLELGFWIPERRCYVGSDGRQLELPCPDSSRTATYLTRNGAPLAVIVHDSALTHHRRLMSGAQAVTELGLENELLQAQVRAQLEDVHASRARIVAAADAERRRLERDLHDGAQQQLVSLLIRLLAARERSSRNDAAGLAAELDRATEELQTAVQELRELARGIHPALLTERGLAAAVHALAERATVPVEVDIPDSRYAPLVEATAYFVISEAVTNATKHARPELVRITARRLGDLLLVEVVDDGVGGADRRRGSGLSGLEDRAAVVGGSVTVDSPAGGGTRVRAELPCG